MKIKALVLSLSALCASTAFADTITPAQQAQLNQLQAEINQLSAQVQQNQSQAVVTDSGQLSMLDNSVNRSVYTDFNQPLGTLPDTSLSYTLLQQQADFKSLITLGGYVEVDGQWQGGNNINNDLAVGSSYNSTTAVALETAKLYFLANVNSWTQAFMAIKGGVNGHSTTISEAFLNFGNLSKNPLYATVGKTYSPFGAFNGNGPWSNTLTTDAFRSYEFNQAIFGYGKDGLNTSISVYNGQNNISNYAYDLSYNATAGNFSYGVGGSYLNDIRYSNTGLGYDYAASGTSPSTATPLTGGKNPAVDLNFQLGYNFGNNQSLSFTGEWASTTGTTIANGNSIGKMSSWQATGGYTIPIYGKNTLFSLGYSRTYNMQDVPLSLNGGITSPVYESATGIKSQWLAFASSEIIENVYLGPEYARQQLYTGAYTWTGTLDLSVYF